MELPTDWKAWAANRPQDWMNRHITASCMQDAGCTIAQIAEAMGKTRRTIQRLLNGPPPRHITHTRTSIDIPEPAG